MTKSITSSVMQFVRIWNASSDLRYKAAAVYSKACDEWDSNARNTFKGLAEFSSWRDCQWTLLYFIGKYMEVKEDAIHNRTWNPEKQTDVISSVYMNFARPSIPLAMRRKGLTVAEQERLFREGAIIADINGKQRHVSIRYMKEKHISQLYDNSGHRRSILEQLKWIKDNQGPNFAILSDGTIEVKHHCYITPALLEKLLKSEPYPLKATTLFKLAQVVKK